MTNNNPLYRALFYDRSGTHAHYRSIIILDIKRSQDGEDQFFWIHDVSKIVYEQYYYRVFKSHSYSVPCSLDRVEHGFHTWEAEEVHCGGV